MPRPSAVNRQVQSVAATNIPTIFETVVAVLNGISTDRPDGLVNLEGECQFTTGTGTTGVQLRIRRGIDGTGTQVGAGPVENAAAGQLIDQELQVQDAPGEVAGQSYCLTVTQIGASGNGTAAQASLAANY